MEGIVAREKGAKSDIMEEKAPFNFFRKQPSVSATPPQYEKRQANSIVSSQEGLQAPSKNDVFLLPAKKSNRLLKVLVLLVLLVGCVVGIVLSVILPSSSDEQLEAIAYGYPSVDADETIDSSRGALLPVSIQNEMLLLFKSSDNTPAGRSYDSHRWEGVAPDFLSYDCDSNDYCKVELQGGGEYTLRLVRHHFTNEQEISRFLSQATFGPTRAEIAEIKSTGIETWISNQINNVSLSSHREYFRKRVNPKAIQVVNPGRPRDACERYSRWRRFTFAYEDRNKELVITNKSLILDGFTFTEVNTSLIIDGFAFSEINETALLNYTNHSLPLGPYFICSVEEKVGGIVSFGPECSYKIENQAIVFSSSLPMDVKVIANDAGLVDLTPPVSDAKLLNIEPQICNVSYTYKGPIFIQSQGQFYLHDPRLVMAENTLESPASKDVATGQSCPNVKMTFSNIDSCKVTKDSCAPIRFSKKDIILNEETLIDLHRYTDRFVYAIDDLREDTIESPCARYRTSRWLIHNNSCGNSANNDDLDFDTTKTLVTLLNESSDPNPFIRDIFHNNEVCTEVNRSAIAAKLDVRNFDGSITCYENIHKQRYNIYDFTEWSLSRSHPGNKFAQDNKLPNPIQKWAKQGKGIMPFPLSHPMSRWESQDYRFRVIGRLYDVIDFQTLPPNLINIEMAKDIGASVQSPVGNIRTCGSPGEVSNDPNIGSIFAVGLSEGGSDTGVVEGRFDGIPPIQYTHFKTVTWTMIALYGSDQLRQRVAAILSQILVINVNDAGNIGFNELYVNYYDIFVRNAFGSYLDVLKEVSFSPVMGEMLSSLGTRSYAWNYQRYGRDIYPDENFAREIMQLFSIGLWKLNNDGTRVLSNGKPVQTYSNDDIMDFARIWTGFNYEVSRGNIESPSGVGQRNYYDPMKLDGVYRDVFPKMNLHKGYIGDGYPLCVDLPTRHFLREGATYRFLGSSPLPELIEDPKVFEVNDGSIKRLNLSSNTSALYSALCNSDAVTGECQYRSKVVLPSNIDCSGLECNVDTVRVVRLYDEENPETIVFYEYTPPPCVEMAFFENGKRVSNEYRQYSVCVNQDLALAGAGCCQEGSNHGGLYFNYHGERMTYKSAAVMCEMEGFTLCKDFYNVDRKAPRDGLTRVWSNTSCNVDITVGPDGRVALVHDFPSVRQNTIDMMGKLNKIDNKNWIRVNWYSGAFPSPGNSCGGAQTDCTIEKIRNKDYCVCHTNVIEKSVFVENVPTREEILEQLSIGSASPEIYDVGTFSQSIHHNGDVIVYSHNEGAYLDSRTVFRVVDQFKEVRFFRNMMSEVKIAGSSTISFRNPPTFMNMGEPTTRDALYETDAALKYYFQHENTAPFIAYRLIQKLVTSNPSSRYVDAVATAFREGTYAGIGSGKYGDLGAAVACILLDREARYSGLDADPSAGYLKEPLMKIINFMRSMEFKPNPTKLQEIELYSLHTRIGQQVYHAPTVFNFFKPEYSPPGPVSKARLVAPEAELLTAPQMIAYMNGIVQLARMGLNHCYGGFATYRNPVNCYQTRQRINDPDEGSVAFSYFEPSDYNKSTVVQDLDLLLTNGRLSQSTKAIVEDAYDWEMAINGPREALRMAQQLIALSPEFQTNNLNPSYQDVRPQPEPKVGTKPYKALVYLYMAGACDSYNVLVPHSECKPGKVNYTQYAQVRTNVAISQSQLLQIMSAPGAQVCNRFGLHPSLQEVKSLYESEEVAFFANVGPLVEPTNKEQYTKKTVELPPSLFGHNTQTEYVQSLKEENKEITGVIGRITDELATQGYVPGAYSISRQSRVLLGRPKVGPPVDIVDRTRGFTRFDEYARDETNYRQKDKVFDAVRNMSAGSKSLVGETWAEAVHQTLERGGQLSDVLDTAVLQTPFSSATNNNRLAQELQMVAKLISIRSQLGHDRDVFYVNIGGFDTHTNLGDQLMNLMGQIDAGLGDFVREMKAQNTWEQVTVLTASEFGRTMTSNGEGTDHAWGGNYWMMSGSLKGGKILGEYPEDLTDDSDLNIGRGRMIPTTPWESIWNAIGKWLDVKDIDRVLPNKKNFPSSTMFNRDDLYN